MLYSLKRIFHNLRRHIGVYLVFILEFAIGIAILSGTLTVLVSLQKDLDAEREKLASDKIKIVCKPPLGVDYSKDIEEDWEKYLIVSSDAFFWLENRYNDSVKLNYYIDSNHEAMIDLHAVFVSDDMFESMFGFPMEEGKIYAAEEVYDDVLNLNEYIQKEGLTYDMFPVKPVVWVQDDKYIVNQNIYQLEKAPACSIEALPSIYYFSLEEYWTKTARCIYIPVKEFPAYRDLLRRDYDPNNVTENEKLPWYVAKSPWFHTGLSIEYKDKNFDVNTLPVMLSFLMDQNSMYEFMSDDKTLDLQHVADSLDGKISDMIAISICVLFVVILGTTGLFLIYLYRRKRQMAVSIAYGATFSRLFWEIFAEIFIVTGTGAVLGVLAIKKIMPYAVQMYHGAEFQPICIVVAIAAAFVSSIIVVGLSFAGIGETSPAKILKDL